MRAKSSNEQSSSGMKKVKQAWTRIKFIIKKKLIASDTKFKGKKRK